jgi:hypothetical protein
VRDTTAARTRRAADINEKRATADAQALPNRTGPISDALKRAAEGTRKDGGRTAGAVSEAKSEDSWRAAILFGSQMTSLEARRMLALKTQQVWSSMREVRRPTFGASWRRQSGINDRPASPTSRPDWPARAGTDGTPVLCPVVRATRKPARHTGSNSASRSIGSVTQRIGDRNPPPPLRSRRPVRSEDLVQTVSSCRRAGPIDRQRCRGRLGLKVTRT